MARDRENDCFIDNALDQLTDEEIERATGDFADADEELFLKLMAALAPCVASADGPSQGTAGAVVVGTATLGSLITLTGADDGVEVDVTSPPPSRPTQGRRSSHLTSWDQARKRSASSPSRCPRHRRPRGCSTRPTTASARRRASGPCDAHPTESVCVRQRNSGSEQHRISLRGRPRRRRSAVQEVLDHVVVRIADMRLGIDHKPRFARCRRGAATRPGAATREPVPVSPAASGAPAPVAAGSP